MKLYIIMLMVIAVSCSYAQTVKIDSAYIYFSQDSNCNANLVVKHRIANNCNLINISSEINNDSITIRICYTMGPLTITCPRRDTICLENLPLGTYNMKVVVFVNNGSSCDNMYRGDSVYRTFSIFPTSIDEVTDASFSLYPNPASDQLVCNVKSLGGRYSIYNIQGRVVTPATTISSTDFNVDVSTLPSGIYYMTIQDDKQRYVKKFVKQ